MQAKMSTRMKERELSVATDILYRQIRDGKHPTSEAPEIMEGAVEQALIRATWTLRRLPDREQGFLQARQVLWPETANEASESTDYMPDDHPRPRRPRLRPQSCDIDQMQPILDLMACLPDVDDRRLLFWAAWHQNGERQARIPWGRVRNSLGANLSRWTLNRRYRNGIGWLARIVAAQQKSEKKNNKKCKKKLAP